jgi:isopropylmalate/homocitrate/citramalate synthase
MNADFARPSPGPWYVPDKWCMSPYNFAPEVQAQHKNRPRRVIIRDVTLGEGQHQPGIKYTIDDMLCVATALREAGITRTKVNLDDYESLAYIKAVRKEIPDIHIHLIHPIYDSDRFTGQQKPRAIEMLDLYAEIGVNEIDIPGFNSWNTPDHIEKAMPRQERLEWYATVTQEAIRRGIEVEAAHVDATRIPWDDFQTHYGNAIAAGAQTLAIYDSYGTCSFDGMKFLVEKCKAHWPGTPVLVHAHNDLGNAEGSMIGGILGGAELCDVSVNGLGDRAGNGCLQEVVMQLEMNYGIDTGVDMSKLLKLCRTVENVTGISFPYIKPVSGRYVFTHESEAHATMVLEQGIDTAFASKHEAYAPKVVGGRRDIKFGGTSLAGGLISLRLEQLGIQPTAALIDKLGASIKERFLSDTQDDIGIAEFDQLARQFYKEGQ